MKIACLKIGLLLACFLFFSGAWAQTKRISGKVLSSEDNQPLAGVSITIKGKKTGTQTNAGGEFAIEASQNEVLQFSYTGFEVTEIPVGAGNTIHVSLKVADKKMDEVVVVGYGRQTRRTLTGSVSSVDGNALKSAPTTNLGTALQGTVSGLRVQQNTGQPGSSPSITFRGGTDFDGTGSPLYVVDGVIVPSLYGLNMDDVESVDLLKDAASTAIYGARAANGVVLVTTKKGKKGRTQVTYSFRAAKNYVRRNPVEYLNAEDYLIWNRRGLGSRFEANIRDNNTGQRNSTRNQMAGSWGWALNSNWTNPDGLYSTQLVNDDNRYLLGTPGWHLLVDRNPFDYTENDSILYRSISQRELEDLILQQSSLKEHHVNFSGGNDQGSFALGLGTVKDEGMVLGSSLKRLNLNFNGGLNVGENLKIGLNVAGYSTNSTPPYTDASSSSNLGGVIQRFGGIAPTVRLTHDYTGEVLPGVSGLALGNPIYLKDKFIDNTTEQRFSGGLNLEYSILPSLKLLASGSGFMRYTNQNTFIKAYQNGTNGAMINTRKASFYHAKTVQYTYNAMLQYDKKFGRHDLSVLGGGEYFDYESYASSAGASGAATDLIPWMSASTIAEGVPTSSFNGWDRLASALGRINYSFDRRYLLTVNLRYDGSSRLAEKVHGFFPGISAGWNLHQERFFDESLLSKYVSTLKPRLSWGQNGSISPLGYFTTDPTYNEVGTYNGYAGFGPNSLVNTGLRWERVSSLNMGLDLGVANNRVTLIADYFIRNVYDKIASLSIPSWTGFSSYTTNLGQLQNRGVELELKADVIRPSKRDGFRWTVGANFSHVKNFAKQLPDNGLERNRQSTIQVYDPKSGTVVQVAGLQEGLRVGLDEIWAYSYDGIYTSQTELDKAAGVFNTNLPYSDKYLKLMGDARWTDLDANDTIDFRDRVYVGRRIPTATGGFSTQLSWKGFSLYGQFDYALGFMIMNQSWLRGISQVQGSQNGPIDIKNTWHPDNPTGTLPRYYWANYGQNYIGFANYYQKGDYLALRELTLNYEVPSQILKSWTNQRLKGIRLHVTGTNLAYFTDYNGTLPEVGGDDPGRFPLPKRLTFGAHITL